MELTHSSPNIWSASRKFWFHFFCCVFILYTFPFPLNDFPFGSVITSLNEKILSWYFTSLEMVTTFWHWLIPEVAKKLLHLKPPITIFSNGSGDTTYDYVLLLTQVLLSFFFAIIWSLLDRKRTSYDNAYYWLHVLLRYYLASNMLGYGFAKVFHLQMPYPSLYRLIQPYGDSSPMGLAWTYVGQSKAFSVFAGVSEVICGLLLLFRKTTLSGALLSLIVMGNVVVINFCFDVPVKLFSSVLEIMALYLVAPYLKQLYLLLIKNKPVVLNKQQQPLIAKRWLRIFIKILKILFIADALILGIWYSVESMNKYGDNAPKAPLYGIYNTITVVRNGDTIAPLITDTTSWKQLVIQWSGLAKIKMMNDTSFYYQFKVDTAKHTAIVFSVKDTLSKANFKYFVDTTSLTLIGKMKNDSVYINFKRFDEKNFLLMNRGFHWINERPFNR